MQPDPKITALIYGCQTPTEVEAKFREEMKKYLDDNSYLVIHSMETVHELNYLGSTSPEIHSWEVEASLRYRDPTAKRTTV